MTIRHLSLGNIRGGLSRELPPMLRLAGPVVAAELGWMTMGLVDTAMVGRLGAEALGGVSIAGSLFIAVTIFGIGMLLGMDFLVSHAHGGGRTDEVNRSLLQGIYLSLVLSAGLMTVILLMMPHLGRLGIEEAVLVHARPYLLAVTLGMPPLLLFVALRRYLQGIGAVRPIMIALVTANLLNFVADYALIFGHWGLPRLGAAGAGWATCVSRVYMLAFIVVAILLRERRERTGLMEMPRQVERARMTRLVQIGFPVAIQITLEVGVFSLATMLAGRLGAVALAANQVALSIASFTFMVPLGLSSAGAVRVGHALGAGDRVAAARSGWTALFTSALFMSLSAVVLALFPGPFLRVFTTDPAVIATGTSLLRMAALFQLFDGLQVTASGVLRGSGDTTKPMLVNLVGHWVVGLPTGYYLAFEVGKGIIGLWGGLSLGLVFCGAVLLAVWSRRVRGWGAAGPASG